MANITISLNDQLLNNSRKYAEAQRSSLNDLIRRLLKKTIENDSTAWLQDSFVLMDKAHGNSAGTKWTRDELHR